MDFIYGIILILIIIFMLINFASVTISNKSSTQMQYDSNQNYLYASNNTPYNNMPYNNNMPNNNMPNTPYNNMPNNNIPQPRNANSPLALNKKINLEEQTYDYNKYFFV